MRTDLGGVTVNRARVTMPDVVAGDCLVHGIGEVLVPPSFLRAVGVDSLNAAVGGEPVGFRDDAVAPDDTARATLAAVCAYVRTQGRFEGIPPVQWRSSGVEAIDAVWEGAVRSVLDDCGAGGVALEAVGFDTSVDG